MKRKVFAFILIVTTLVSVNAAVVSADGGSARAAADVSGSVVPLFHGVDH
ncbi:hypothetical protein ['Paenibacillus yunnanensis' Narsing Rao et al. 2020]|nr:hypothetical protein [Paenibacillus tengchongensis]